MSSFCTNRRIASSSHTPSMLRTRYLTSHKNNLIIDDFFVDIGLFCLTLFARIVGYRVPRIRQVCSGLAT